MVIDRVFSPGIYFVGDHKNLGKDVCFESSSTIQDSIDAKLVKDKPATFTSEVNINSDQLKSITEKEIKSREGYFILPIEIGIYYVENGKSYLASVKNIKTNPNLPLLPECKAIVETNTENDGEKKKLYLKPKGNGNYEYGGFFAGLKISQTLPRILLKTPEFSF